MWSIRGMVKGPMERVACGYEPGMQRAVVAAVFTTLALGAPATADTAPPTREHPVPATTLTLRFHKLRVKQGGQRVHVTIPVSAGTNQFGDTLTYQWDTHVSGGARCQPGALPDLTGVAAGTVIDAPLPMPPGGWCHGSYGVTLNAVVVVNCDNDPPPNCRFNPQFGDQVADESFDVVPPPKSVCHRLREVRRCWSAPSVRDPGGWDLTAPLDDLLGPDGATSDADPYFERAFAHHPIFQRDWETDDDTFYGWATRRSQAARMAVIVDRVLRSGRYYGKRRPGRPKQ
jgi:hypothetical protein